MDEKKLIQSAGQGSVQAFLTLMQPYEDALYATMLTAAGDPDRALDLTLDALVRAWHGIGLYQFDEHLSQWLHRIARDTYQDSKGKDPWPEENPLMGQPTAETAPENLQEILSRRLRQDGGFSLKKLLGRGKFTLLALGIVAVMLLVSWLQKGATKPGTPAPTHTPVAPPAVSAELAPGA